MSAFDLRQVRTFDVPDAVAAATDTALREAGQRGHERFVLWTGTGKGSSFVVEHAIVPRQTGHRLPDGVCVTVGGEELHRINRWLFEQSQTLAAQIHSHPTHAFHSETDDTFPIATQLGALSIVVPDFGSAGVRGAGVATYRLTTSGWSQQGWWSRRRLIHHGASAISGADTEGPHDGTG